VTQLARRMRARRERGERGQSLVEFALIFPIFILLFIGLIEFSITLSVMLNVNYASRDSALISAEVGDAVGADCLILQRLDKALGGGAAHHSGIQQVRIFWADADSTDSQGRLHSGLDTIGVSILFHHDWLTPLPNLVSVPPTGVTFDRSNTMRMEPVL